MGLRHRQEPLIVSKAEGITSDGVEIDITDDVEQLQLENITSHLISKSIDREADRVKQYSKNIASFKSGKREALHAIINQLSLKTVTYKVNILEKAEQIDKIEDRYEESASGD